MKSGCTHLDCLPLDSLYNDDVIALSEEQQHILDLLLDRKRLCTHALELLDGSGSPPQLLEVFQMLLQANAHEHGLSASFVILRDYMFAEHNP